MMETVLTGGMRSTTPRIAAYDGDSCCRLGDIDGRHEVGNRYCLTAHRPDPRQVSGRWRVDCSCGWRGPVVPLPGHGTAPWAEHFAEVQ